MHNLPILAAREAFVGAPASGGPCPSMHGTTCRFVTFLTQESMGKSGF
jgi:hypothetical protein